MDFYAILDQVIALLRQRQRVTYRALKVHFQLDDEALEALKEELIEAQQLARDESGRILVWAGEATPFSDPVSVTPPAQIVLPPHTQTDQASQGEVSRIERRTTDAERRQLTVLFCDLADSTRLARQLDPEDLRAVVRAYQETAAAVIQRYDGHIAQYLGDGLLVYFGYPQAHEDDAQRAVRSGLELLAALRTLNTRLVPEHRVRLAVRIGIHTGLVVVGAMGSGDRHEHLALGDTPNLAARLQGLAEPDTVVISDTTARLVQGYFVCQDRGVQTLKGIDTPVRVAQVVGASAAQSRLEMAAATGLTPLVGREAEVALLRERWAQSTDGRGHVVLLSGEAGIGKSRLVHVLTERMVDMGVPRVTLRCSPYHTNSALYPVIEHLRRLLHWHREETLEARLATLEHALRTVPLPLAETVPLLAALLALPVPERYPPLTLSPQRQKQKTQETLVAWLLADTAQQPVLAVWEDLHWADPSTLELLGLLLDQVPTAHLLLVLTYRPEFRPPWAPRSYITPFTLTRLVRPQVEEMVLRVTGGKPLPAEVVQQIVAKTDGIPLFVEELVKTILESGLVREEAGCYVLTGPLPPLAIPTTLQDALMARLDGLAAVKEVAQLGAVLGREFSYTLLRAVAPLEEPALQQSLAQLVEAELLYQRGHPPQATYLFKHALVQDAAYQSLLRSTRQQYHERIAQVLEAQFPDTVEAQPELLAHHYTEAGLHEQAVRYWHQAGQQAIHRSAHVEAIAHLTQGLAVLTTLPPTPERARQELAFQTALGPALIAVRGYAADEVEHVYLRARELSQEVDDTAERVRALMGLYVLFFVRANHEAVHALTGELLQVGQALQDPLALVQTYTHEGESLLWQGQFALARTHLEHAKSLYRPQRYAPSAYFFGHHPVVQTLSELAIVLWVLGYPERAVQQCDEALTFAQGLSHPFSLAFALSPKVLLHLLRREANMVQEYAETLVTVSTEHGFPLRAAHGSILLGWAMVERGIGKAGIARIEEGIAAWQATGAKLHSAWWLGLRAEVYGKLGRVEEGLTVLAEALRAVEDTGEHFYDAELQRLKGEFLLQLSVDNQREAEACFQHAIAIAQDQGAKAWELRTATSLARLWQQQGKRAEAHELLSPVYGWFTEGFDTADLQEGKALLEALA